MLSFDLLQSGAPFIKNWDKYYKAFLLKSGEGITKWNKHYYKLGKLRIIRKWGKSY